jgi:hypothetical protein
MQQTARLASRVRRDLSERGTRFGSSISAKVAAPNGAQLAKATLFLGERQLCSPRTVSYLIEVKHVAPFCFTRIIRVRSTLSPRVFVHRSRATLAPFDNLACANSGKYAYFAIGNDFYSQKAGI